ncbi:MAG: dephospho-CoA kinase, partial [Candidatus Omnitrophica bacterium]|nr:dephospho-CoA kinase [Candidatus Omnitrophota bacterium]
MIIIGITGSFGTGKSTVAKIFASLGVKIIDTDKIVHKILRHDDKVSKQIIKVFGQGILDNSKNISREKLGKVVFRNNKLLKKLCDIIHPEVIKKIRFEIGV